MNRKKRTDVIRKRNIELSAQLNELRQKLNEQPEAQELISKLQKIERDWLNAIQELDKRRRRYDELIADMQAIKKAMINIGFNVRIPWYKRLMRKIKRH